MLWNVPGSVLAVAGACLFALVYAVFHGRGGFELQGPAVLGALAVTSLTFVLLLILHELVHGFAIRRFGGRPTYGAGVTYRLMPYFCCTVPGHRFDKSQYAIVCAAPMVVISLFGAICVAFVPNGGWSVIPLGLHLGGCIGDVWFLGIIRRPKDAIFEDLGTGVRILRPD